MKWFAIFVIQFAFFGAGPVYAEQPRLGEILVIVSSENKITLKEGVTHPTGFFFQEMMVPVRELIRAGYSVTLANPKGNAPVMDAVSDSPMWFGDMDGQPENVRTQARKEFAELRKLCEDLEFCNVKGNLVAPKAAIRLNSVIASGLDRFDAVFFPGGHAPMEDLLKDSDVGKVLRHFHDTKKPTALICHGPIALLAALNDPQAFINAKIVDDRQTMVAESKIWIYRDYKMASFTTREEQQEEPGGQDNALGGFVRFYPDSALESAGAEVLRGDKWQSNVVVYRELITGQNPFSDRKFAEELLKALGH